MWLQLNETPLGHAYLIPEGQEKSRYYSWDNILKGTTEVVFSVPAMALKDGRNWLVFRNEGEQVTVLGIALRTGKSLHG